MRMLASAPDDTRRVCFSNSYPGLAIVDSPPPLNAITARESGTCLLHCLDEPRRQ